MSKKKDSIGSNAFTKDMENTKNLETAISIGPQIGQHLIKEAIKSVEEAQQKQVVNQVSDIMERLRLMRTILNKTTRRIQLCQDQLQAINKGEFVVIAIGFAGVPGQKLQNGLKFNDPKLNIDWSETERWT